MGAARPATAEGARTRRSRVRLVAVAGVAPDAPPEEQYAYDGPPIPFDAGGVRSLVLNPTTTSYAEGTQARYANDTFNYSYTSLLKSLHQTFNGRPEMLMSAVGVMESCKQQALAMGELRVSGTTLAGPELPVPADRLPWKISAKR